MKHQNNFPGNILTGVVNTLFIRELSPDHDYYRILLIKVLTAFLVPLIGVEVVTAVCLGYYSIAAVEAAWILIFFLLLPRWRKKPHVLGNVFILCYLTISIAAIANYLENPVLLLFLEVTPVLMVFLLGLRKSLVWLTMLGGALAVSTTVFYFQHDRLPWDRSYFIIALVVFAYSLFITAAYERTNRLLLRELKQQAELDPLTKIYNRRKFQEVLGKEIVRHRRYQGSLSLMMLDLDRFKLVNDTHGHDAGDLVLKRTVRIIRENLRQSDVPARYGGEEFMILLPQTSLESAEVTGDKLRRLIADHIFDRVGHCTVSIGISAFAPDDTEDTLIKRADTALYRAKENGRNRVELARA